MLSAVFILFLTGFYLYNQRKAYLVLFFFILTNGFQVFPSNYWGFGVNFLDKPIDIIWISSVIIIFSDFKRILRLLNRQYMRRYFLLLLILMSVACVVAFSNLVPAAGQIRVLRVECIPFVALCFLKFQQKDFVFLFSFLFKVTIIQSILFLMQIVTGETLLFTPFSGSDVLTNEDNTTGLVRFYNSPAFITLYLYYSLFRVSEKASLKNCLIFLILFGATIGPLHRGVVLSIALALIFFNLVNGFGFKKLLTMLAGLLAATFVIFFVPGLSERFFNAYRDMASIVDYRSINLVSENESTFGFRMLHLWERINFISRDSVRFFAGVGPMPEDIPIARELPLFIGNYKEELNGIKKIDTSDIVWSPLLLRYGILGVSLLLYFITVYFREAHRHRDDIITKSVTLYMLAAIFGSFSGSELTSVHLKLLVIMTVFCYFNSSLLKNANRLSHFQVSASKIPFLIWIVLIGTKLNLFLGGAFL